MHFHNQIINL